MTPTLIHRRGTRLSEDAFLVDFDARLEPAEVGGNRGALMHYVHLAAHGPGELPFTATIAEGRVVSEEVSLLRCGCEVFDGDWSFQQDLRGRGLRDDAARALLRLVQDAMPIQPGQLGSLEFTPGELGTGDEMFRWRFVTAWCWSLWQNDQDAGTRWRLEDRWRYLKRLGYPSGQSAFRALCNGLGLFVRQSGRSA